VILKASSTNTERNNLRILNNFKIKSEFTTNLYFEGIMIEGVNRNSFKEIAGITKNKN